MYLTVPCCYCSLKGTQAEFCYSIFTCKFCENGLLFAYKIARCPRYTTSHRQTVALLDWRVTFTANKTECTPDTMPANSFSFESWQFLLETNSVIKCQTSLICVPEKNNGRKFQCFHS